MNKDRIEYNTGSRMFFAGVAANEMSELLPVSKITDNHINGYIDTAIGVYPPKMTLEEYNENYSSWM